MIVESIINIIFAVIRIPFSLLSIPSLSDYDVDLSLITEFLNSSKSLINLFLPWDLVRFGLPILIVVLNSEYIYNLIMWILRKIPMIGIE